MASLVDPTYTQNILNAASTAAQIQGQAADRLRLSSSEIGTAAKDLGEGLYNIGREKDAKSLREEQIKQIKLNNYLQEKTKDSQISRQNAEAE